MTDMKKILHTLSYKSVMAGVISLTLSFANTAYGSTKVANNELKDKCHLVEAIPENNATVEKLRSIMTQWEGPEELGWGIGVSESKSAVEVRNADGETVASGVLRDTPSGIQISIPQEITEPGTYTVTVRPDMVFIIKDMDEDTMELIMEPGTGNEETTLTYTVAEPVEKCHLVEAIPENNATVEKLRSIMTQWEGPEELGWGIGVSESKSAVEVRNADGETVASGVLRDTPSGIQISIPQEITEPGTYTVTVRPDMVFIIQDMDEDTMELIMEPGTGNEETTLTYTVEAVPLTKYALISATPADNATVESLKTITTQWEGQETPYTWYVNPQNQSVEVKDANGSIVTFGRLIDKNTSIEISLDRVLKTDGIYSITILPDKVFATSGIDDEDNKIVIPGTGNEATTLTYTIKTSGSINIIDPDSQRIHYEDGILKTDGILNPQISIYSYAGELVASNQGKDMLDCSTLPAGIYIAKIQNGSNIHVLKIAVR